MENVLQKKQEQKETESEFLEYLAAHILNILRSAQTMVVPSWVLHMYHPAQKNSGYATDHVTTKTVT